MYQEAAREKSKCSLKIWHQPAKTSYESSERAFQV